MSNVDIPEGTPKWMADHIRQYLESDGAEGHMWDSSTVGGPGLLPTLLLTTTGRRSGKPRLMPLLYTKDGDNVVVVASKGGAPKHPAWYVNLTSQPEVGVQVGTDRFRATARVTEGTERARLWQQMVDLYPPYTDYQKKTEREIPVVLLERMAD